MKKIAFVLLALPFAFACNNSANDSVERADSANEAKMDTSNNNMNTQAVPVDANTSQFMVKVADGGMTEVNAGQIAQQKAQNQRVKDFGAMMVKDHTAAGEELKNLAGRKNVTLPTSMSNDHQDAINDLNKKTGKNFDKDFMDMMVRDHKKTIDDFKDAQNNTNDADVKAWIEKTLPTLQMHLDSAQAIQKALSGK
jgi:putative membrane protein